MTLIFLYFVGILITYALYCYQIADVAKQVNEHPELKRFFNYSDPNDLKPIILIASIIWPICLVLDLIAYFIS